MRVVQSRSLGSEVRVTYITRPSNQTSSSVVIYGSGLLISTIKKLDIVQLVCEIYRIGVIIGALLRALDLEEDI